MCELWFAQVVCCQGMPLHMPVCTATWGSPVNVCVCVHVRGSVGVHARVLVCVCACLRACVHACACVRMCMGVCVCVCCCSSWWLKACFLPDIPSHTPQDPGIVLGSVSPFLSKAWLGKGWEGCMHCFPAHSAGGLGMRPGWPREPLLVLWGVGGCAIPGGRSGHLLPPWH